MRRYLFCLLAMVFFCQAVPAVDAIQSVTAVWRDFVASVRRGDYPNAHSLFSAQSQTALPYAEFVEEYGPLSVAREMVLARPDSQSTDLGDDWAEITYGGANPASGRKFRVGVSFVANDGGWGLVAARNELPERIEAGARTMLRMLWNARSQAQPRQLVAALTSAQSDSPVFQAYRLETDGTTFRAFPLQKPFRTFYVDNFGQVKSVERTPPPPQRKNAASLPVPERSSLPKAPAGPTVAAPKPRAEMEELSEPPPRRLQTKAEAGLDDELPEPRVRNSRGNGNGSVKNRPPAITLPDSIR